MNKKILLLKFITIFLCVGIPIIFFINHIVWITISTIYMFFSLTFIWFLTILLFIAMIKEEKEPFLIKDKFTVILPTYNEKPDKLLTTFNSIKNAAGNKEIIIIDDGSKTNEGWNLIKKLKENNPILIKHIHKFNKNKGKREAQAYAIKKADTEIIISVDSNAIFKKTAFLNLIYHLKDKKIGLVTGQVLILNEFDSILNRIQGALWWCASNKGRLALSNFGYMGSACGKLMAFRKSDLMPILNEFTSQTFAGYKVISGDDGFLTSLYIREGFKVKYEKNALCLGYAKSSYRMYIKQQLRWKKNIIRRSIWALTNISWKNNLIFMIYILGNLILPYILISIMITFLVSIIINQSYYLLFNLFIGIIVIMLVQDLVMIYDNKKRGLSFLPFVMFNICFIMPLWIVGLFTMEDTGWGTR